MGSGTATPEELDLPGAEPAGTATASEEQVSEVSQELIRHQRLMHMLKAEMANWGPEGLEFGSHAVLMHLVKGGAMRQNALADCSLLDPSTISRRVSQLVGAGYVERRPDPADGRAVVLAATDAGQEVFAQIAGRRHELLKQLFADWTSEEVESFSRQFRRLNDRLESIRPLLADLGPDRLTGRPPTERAARAGNAAG